MKSRIVLFLLVLAALWCFCAVGRSQQFYLHPDDRVLFEGGPDPAGRLYERLIEAFVLTRFPEWHTEFRRWNDDGSTDRPTVLLVGTSFDSVEKLYNSGTLPRPRLTFLQIVSGFTLPAGSVALDLTAFMTAQVEKVRAIDPAVAAAILVRGVPAGASGHLLAAQAVLQAWHAPNLVSSVEINALHGIITLSENTTVRNLENDRVIAWSQDDRTLPVAIDFKDPGVALTVRCSELVRLLDQQTLRITGMAAERYRLTIDGEPQGEFHRDQLDRGLTLSLMATPMWKQAMEVYALTGKHEEFDAARRRLFQVPVPQRSAEWKSELEALDASEAGLVAALRSKARPKTHDYELQPVER